MAVAQGATVLREAIPSRYFPPRVPGRYLQHALGSRKNQNRGYTMTRFLLGTSTKEILRHNICALIILT